MMQRRLLITAGPTWVPIDAVRHLANFSTGRMGATLARTAVAAGWATTLLYGPGRHAITAADERQMRVVRFTTLDELHRLLREELASRAYAGLLHAAAVSDYRPAEIQPGKLDSTASELCLRLVRTPKLIDEVKSLDPEIVLAAFKLTAGQPLGEMIQAAQALRLRSRAELVVANDHATLSHDRHPALLLDEAGIVAEAETPDELAEALLSAVAERARR
jgi:phosphopantothenoylcysteine synthetase/decarboxylase